MFTDNQISYNVICQTDTKYWPVHQNKFYWRLRSALSHPGWILWCVTMTADVSLLRIIRIWVHLKRNYTYVHQWPSKKMTYWCSRLLWDQLEIVNVMVKTTPYHDWNLSLTLCLCLDKVVPPEWWNNRLFPRIAHGVFPSLIRTRWHQRLVKNLISAGKCWISQSKPMPYVP